MQVTPSVPYFLFTSQPRQLGFSGRTVLLRNKFNTVCRRRAFSKKEDTQMLNWAITFLVIALIAGILGLTGVAGAATQIAWILFVVFLVLFLVGLIMGRRPPV